MSFDLTNLKTDVCLAQDAIRSADRDCSEWQLGTEHLATLLGIRRIVLDTISDARGVAEAIENAVGQVMDQPTFDVEGFGMVKRHPRTTKRNWDHEGLLRAVLDSRLVDTETGEMLEETPLERVKAVWNLAGYSARSGALRSRAIAEDEYCETERRGWKLELKGHNK